MLPAADLYPTWLLPVPQRLVVRQISHLGGPQQGIPHYHGELTLLAGPQRLETGWLEGEPALRDYYIARSPQAGLVWVYCERLGRVVPQAASEAFRPRTHCRGTCTVYLA